MLHRVNPTFLLMAFKRKPSFNKDKKSNFATERTNIETKKSVAREEARKPLKVKPPPPVAGEPDEDMRLNKYVAACGICSRRKAAEHIEAGKVRVNDQLVKEIGYRVQPDDKVYFDDKLIKTVRNLVYVLLNKPRGVITTANDEKDRKTVLDIVGETVKERIYPVGRLDRDTSGLLLLTNDGDLAQKLSHPSKQIAKIYHAELDKNISKSDLERIAAGVTLEDGVAPVDWIGYVEEGKKNIIGIEVHIGRNRIVRRIFEHLGYEVTKLDRMHYAGLTKKDLPRGRYRRLTEREVIMLKHFTK